MIRSGELQARVHSSATPHVYAYERDPRRITEQSFDLIADEVDFSNIAEANVPLATRMIHACGMIDLVADIAATKEAGSAGCRALSGGAPLLCDSRMVAAGIMANRLPSNNEILIGLDQPGCAEHAKTIGNTRSAAGMVLMADKFAGSVVVIGNAPTALFHVLELIAAGAGHPALIVGLPVGLIGAAESKDALIANAHGLEFITVRGRRGGSAIAASAVNALLVG